jgi:hypothetical protein
MSNEARWWLFIHQIPPKPAYLRVKIGRRLARLGAVAIKATVYALPHTEAAAEDLQWVSREIVAGGGEATLVEARFAGGLSDEEVIGLFHEAREADYAALVGEATRTESTMPGEISSGDERRGGWEAEVGRYEKQLGELIAIDFFGAPGQRAAALVVARLRGRLQPPAPVAMARGEGFDEYRGRTWVTRAGVHVDRIASAWLIRRFIDAGASFAFVAPREHVPGKGQVRFDMFDAEFTHEGEDCTFEVLVRRFGLAVPGLAAIAEVIHDIDVKDGKFGRPETPGVAALIAGLALRCRDDEQRLRAGAELFDSLLSYFERKKSHA